MVSARAAVGVGAFADRFEGRARGIQALGRLPQQLAGVVAKDLLEPAIARHHPPVLQVGDADQGVVQDRLAFGQQPLRLLVLRMLAGDIEGQAAQYRRLAILGDHPDPVAQPEELAVAVDEAIIEVVGRLAVGTACAIGGCPGAFVGVQMVNPEVRLLPVGERESQQAFGLGTDEGELEGLRVGLPDDAVDRLDEVLMTLAEDLQAADHARGKDTGEREQPGQHQHGGKRR
jgi:hypothetical protein